MSRTVQALWTPASVDAQVPDQPLLNLFTDPKPHRRSSSGGS
jgi:hypothetical protein